MIRRTSGIIIDEANVICRVHRSFSDTAGVGFKLIQEAIPGKCIRVLSGLLLSNAQVDIYFCSGPQYAKKSGTYALISNQGFNLNSSDDGHFQTNKGEGLYLNHNASALIGFTFRFILTEVEDPT